MQKRDFKLSPIDRSPGDFVPLNVHPQQAPNPVHYVSPPTSGRWERDTREPELLFVAVILKALHSVVNTRLPYVAQWTPSRV